MKEKDVGALSQHEPQGRMPGLLRLKEAAMGLVLCLASHLQQLQGSVGQAIMTEEMVMMETEIVVETEMTETGTEMTAEGMGDVEDVMVDVGGAEIEVELFLHVATATFGDHTGVSW